MQLEQQLARAATRLRATVEQYETSTEELKASNEELQAMNEELRSATEELETSREELQSINEELTTVNHELKSKVDELGHANSDLHNLMGATAIATVFLDRELRITRYTPSAVPLFNLIPTDVGRPLSDLTTRLDYPTLSDDARRVLERLVPVEREVGQSDGRWFLARLAALPHAGRPHRRRGADLHRHHRAQARPGGAAPVGGALQCHRHRGRRRRRAGHLEGRITFANRFYIELMGYTEEELFGRRLFDRDPDDLPRAAERPRLVEHGDSLPHRGAAVEKAVSLGAGCATASWLTACHGRTGGAAGLRAGAVHRHQRTQAGRGRAAPQRGAACAWWSRTRVEYAIFSTD